MRSWKAELKSRVEVPSQQKEDPQQACRVTRKKVHVREMLGTSRIAVFFQWFVVPDVRKVASLKRRVRRWLFIRQVKNGTPLWREAHLQVKMHKHHNLGAIVEVPMFKNGTPLWREAHVQVKMHKTPQSRTNFGSFDPAKLHAAVARSAFASQNVQNTCVLQQFERFVPE